MKHLKYPPLTGLLVMPTTLCALLLGLVAETGCISSTTANQQVAMEKPRASQGVLTQEAREDGLLQMAQALAQNEPKKEPASTVPTPPAVPAPVVVPVAAGPGIAGVLVQLPKLSATETEEIIAALCLRFETELGYVKASSTERNLLPPLAEDAEHAVALVRKAGGQLQVLRLASKTYYSQAAQLIVHGVLVEGEKRSSNPDVASVESRVATVVKSIQQGRENLNISDLSYTTTQLSYMDIKGALTALKGLGVTTLDDMSKITFPIPFAQLPVIAPLPGPSTNQMGLLGKETTAAGAFDLSMTPGVATSLPSDPNMSPASQLIIYYHPAHPEQLNRVKRMLEDTVDRPAGQIFVEGMVLEISEEGLKELGIEWQFSEGKFQYMMGAVDPNAATKPPLMTANPAVAAVLPASTLASGLNSLNGFAENWQVKLRALVQNKKAEMLSRPSVLTLNNRQATIRVGQDIPIATMLDYGQVTGVSRMGFNFRYLPIGISLNILPRVTGDGREVGMLIDTIVSTDMNDPLEIKDGEKVLARAPQIATRRIQTYARIMNNTPFIIGGLISKENQTTELKIPLLGDIPYLGNAFKTKLHSNSKREVIIVLTPHILSGDNELAGGRYLPRDQDTFDEFGNQLFKSTYRIRSEDVYDLSFIANDPRIARYRNLANQAIVNDYRLASQSPFDIWSKNHLPGEECLVQRMIYQMIRRLYEDGRARDSLLGAIRTDNLILFGKKQTGGYDVIWFEEVLKEQFGVPDMKQFQKKHPDKAISIHFNQLMRTNAAEMLQDPIPEISLVDCSKTDWDRQLWDGNQPFPNGEQQHVILLRTEDDLLRLRRCILLKKVIHANGGRSRMNLLNFTQGRQLVMPDVKAGQTCLIDPEVAEAFYYSHHYYAAVAAAIDKAGAALESSLGKLTPQLLKK
ncbi:MAG: hypothetical protein WCO56_27540 [Verrucomicrobiota bacterium]